MPFPTVEHIAWQHPDPVAAAAWYGRHLGFNIARKLYQAPHTHFLADAAGRVVIEIYNNPKAPVPDYRAMDPLVLHLAFSVSDPIAARDRLLTAGATIADNLCTLPNGDRLVMLRDPWGFAIQLARRTTALVPST
jgi:catechol 2,3-dioxygenase-like lactoylglutathione lyase family enzyme